MIADVLMHQLEDLPLTVLQLGDIGLKAVHSAAQPADPDEDSDGGYEEQVEGGGGDGIDGYRHYWLRSRGGGVGKDCTIDDGVHGGREPWSEDIEWGQREHLMKGSVGVWDWAAARVYYVVGLGEWGLSSCWEGWGEGVRTADGRGLWMEGRALAGRAPFACRNGIPKYSIACRQM